jgi:hypothetical protein
MSIINLTANHEKFIKIKITINFQTSFHRSHIDHNLKRFFNAIHIKIKTDNVKIIFLKSTQNHFNVGIIAGSKTVAG